MEKTKERMKGGVGGEGRGDNQCECSESLNTNRVEGWKAIPLTSQNDFRYQNNFFYIIYRIKIKPQGQFSGWNPETWSH